LPNSRALASTVLLALAASACRQDMHDQPKLQPLEASRFFEDGRASRPLVPGTIPRGYLREDTRFFTGMAAGKDIAELPFRATAAVLERGQERFNIFCSPCHDRLGNGLGMVVRRGFRRPPTFHSDRLRAQPVGHFFDVMTNGFGAMQDYAAQVEPKDRWAIAAYIRALQLSQYARLASLPESMRAAIPAGSKKGGVR
jgi:mono/diheme cytochrome c family protein